MEKSAEELQKMVYETLLESKKPLMAKRIAYNIFRKYDGYRMSRFVVRDIIWKQMKDIIIYDNVNYTYTVNKSKEEQNMIVNPYTSKDNNHIISNSIIPKKGKYDELLNKLENSDSINILSEFKDLIKGNYLKVNTGYDKIDQLISTVVKDNKITRSEEIFLNQKTLEYGLPYELIDRAKEMMNSNNPYLDNIIHLIFEDGNVKDEELAFLKEKKRENNFSKSFLNQRFWQIGICYYLNALLQLDDFHKIVKLWHIGNTLKFELINIDKWLLMKLNIHTSNSIEVIISKGVEAIEVQLKEHIKENYSFYSNHLINNLYKEINLITTKKGNDKNLSSSPQHMQYEELINILREEKRRIGDPAANLLAENILFRLKNKEWD